MNKYKTLSLLSIALLLVSCGGPTSSASNPPSNPSSDSSTSQGDSSTSVPDPVKEDYSITVSTSTTGVTLTPSVERAYAGDIVTITATITDDAYTLVDVLYDNQSCTKTSDTEYWFTMPDHPVTISCKVNIEGDVTLQGGLSQAFTKEGDVYVLKGAKVAQETVFDVVVRADSGEEQTLGVMDIDRYNTFANITSARSGGNFEIAGGATYDFTYNPKAAKPLSVVRTNVDTLPTSVDGLYSLFAGSALSEYTVNPANVTSVKYTNSMANETYAWKLYDDGTSYAKVTQRDSNNQEVTKAEVYKKLEEDKLTVVDTYTPAIEKAYDYDYSCMDDTEKYSGIYTIGSTNENNNPTSEISFDIHDNYVNANTAQFVLRDYNHNMESIETDFMHSYRVGMTVEDYVKQASVNITSEDTTDGFTVKIVSSKTYDESGTSSGTSQYHAEYRATIDFLDNGAVASLDYEYKYFYADSFNFSTLTWVSGDTETNYQNNGTLMNKVTVNYTYSETLNDVDYTFDTTPYFVSSISSFTVDNPAADIESQYALNIGDQVNDFLEFTVAPETALNTWQYEVISSSNLDAIAYDDSYLTYAAVGTGTSTLTLGTPANIGVTSSIDVEVDYTYLLRNIYLFENWGEYAPIESTTRATLNAGTIATYGLQAKESTNNTVIPLPADTVVTWVEGEDLGATVTLNRQESTMTVNASNVVVSEPTQIKVRLDTAFYDPDWIDEPIEFTFTINPGVTANGLVGTFTSSDYPGDSITFTTNASSTIPGYEGTLDYVGSIIAEGVSYTFAWSLNSLGEIEADIIITSVFPAGASCNLYFSYDTSTNQLGVLFNYGIYDESGVTTTEIFGYYDEENYPVFDYFSK